jgi:hypothetical protein
MSDQPKDRPKDDKHDLLFSEDSHTPGDYNQESILGGKRTLSMRRPIPVFGMRHVSHQGADLDHVIPQPKSKKMTESEVRELIVRNALDTQGFIAELRRLFEIGAIDYTPDNIKKLVDAEKGNAEVLLRALDPTNKMGIPGDNKTIALQIINNVTQIIDKGFDKAREGMSKDRTIEASVEAVEVVKHSAQRLELRPETPEPNFLDTADVEEFVELRRRGE